MDLLLAVNSATAFLTATLSGFLGLGGGILLLAVFFLTMNASIAIPLHGCVQLVSNSTRSFLFMKHCDRSIFLKFAAGAIPASFLSIFLVRFLNPVSSSMAFGAFILLVLYFPSKRFDLSTLTSSFLVAGGLAGLCSAILGATGPMIAPFFLSHRTSKETTIATMAVCQMLVHLMKIALFGFVLNFDFLEYKLWIGCMVLASIAGTYLGKYILTKHISERFFVFLYRSTLTLIALKMLLYTPLAF